MISIEHALGALPLSDLGLVPYHASFCGSSCQPRLQKPCSKHKLDCTVSSKTFIYEFLGAFSLLSEHAFKKIDGKDKALAILNGSVRPSTFTERLFRLLLNLHSHVFLRAVISLDKKIIVQIIRNMLIPCCLPGPHSNLIFSFTHLSLAGLPNRLPHIPL